MAVIKSAFPCSYLIEDVFFLYLPPIKDIDRLKAAILLTPARHRDDAIQEAWVAHLSGNCPISAVDCYRIKERRIEKRHVSINDVIDKLNGNDGVDDSYD